jgi:DNA-binding transcriptional regulator YdaS (Cro superfamily)
MRKKISSAHANELRVDAMLRKAIEIAGGMRALGRAIGTSHQNIRQWKITPPTRVLAIERVTGIHRSLLRPDIYPEGDYPRKQPVGGEA